MTVSTDARKTGIPAALQQSPRFFGFGDSITADGGRVINAAAAPTTNVFKWSWHRYAELALQGKIQWGGSFGLASQTINQLRNIYLPYLLSYIRAGDYVVILMGQNSLATVSAQDLADYQTTVTSILAVGGIPILCTLTPGATTLNFHKLNTWIRYLAAQYGLQICDLYAAVIDPATGGWLAANTRDGTTHPSEVGAKLMGATLGTVLNTLTVNYNGGAWLANSDVGYGSNRTTQTGGNNVPTFQTDTGSTPPLPSTQWGIQGGSHAAATAFSAGTVGRILTLTATATTLIVRQNTSTVLPGDRLRVSFAFTPTVAATSGTWGFSISDGGGTQLYDTGRNNGSPSSLDLTRSVLSVDITHSGTAGLLFDIALTGNGSTFKLEQFTVLNLTAMGLV